MSPVLTTIPVVVSKRFDPALARIVEHSEGTTLAEMIAAEFADATAEQISRLDVILINSDSEMRVDQQHWRRVRPRAGAQVIIRARLAKGDALRTILSIVVLVSAAFLGPLVAGALGFGTTGFAATAISSLMVLGGNLLISALLPQAKNKGEKRAERYSLTGGRNAMTPWGAVPDIKGRVRIYPPMTAEPYTYTVGDNQYLRMQFLIGYAPLDLSDFKIGETALADFKSVSLYTRTIIPGAPVDGYYPEPVFQENINVDLKQTSPFSVGDNWQRQVTASFITEIEVDYTFPRGLCSFTKEGKKRAFAVTVACRWRKKGDTDWIDRPDIEFIAASVEPIRRSDRWSVPAVGQYEIELRRVSADNDSTQISDQVVWTAWRGFRPVRTIRMKKSVVLCDLEILATGQLNGVVDQFNCVAHSIRPDYDAGSDTWVTRATSNPASLYRDVLQGAATHLPRTDAQIDLNALKDWAIFCTTKGLSYNAAHSTAESLDEVLGEIASAGRAMPSRHYGIHSVVIDQPQSVIRGLITPRNAHSFAGEVSYRNVEDALRVKFMDSTDGWKKTERIVKRPGFTGDPVTFLEMEFPGVTDATQAYRAALRWFHERLLRFETYYATQDYEALFAPIGSLVMLTFPVLDERRSEARVIAAGGGQVMLDRPVTMEAGTSYGLRGRTAANGHYVRTIATVAGTTDVVTLTDTGPIPVPGELVVFGIAGEEAVEAIVKAVESQKDLSARLTMVRHAPELEGLVDSVTVPDWLPLIPDPRPYDAVAPAAPIIVRVLSGSAAMEDGGTTPPVTVMVSAGAGNLPSLASFTVAANGSTVTIPASSGRATFSFAAGTTLSVTARATSLSGVTGPWSVATSHVVLARDDLPANVTALSVIRLASGTRRYEWTIDPAAPDAQRADVIGVRLRARPGTGWAWSDLGALHEGVISVTPHERIDPFTEGTHTVGVVGVDEAGQESTPFLIVADLGAPYGAGVLLQRIETQLGWPGTVTGGSLVSGILTGTAGTSLVYETPDIDLGSDRSIVMQAVPYGVTGTASVQVRKGLTADGATTGSWTSPGTTTARYVRFRVTVTAPTGVAPRLFDFVTIIN